MAVKVAPKSITILGQRYKVQQFAHVESDEGKPMLADIDQDNAVIRLGTHGVSLDQQAESLLHEVLHGIFKKAGMDTAAPGHEDLVNRISPILLQFLRQNPNVYTFLTGRRLW